jgi:sec-independent protein translocase protein TatC
MSRKTKQRKQTPKQARRAKRPEGDARLAFIEHVYELRRRIIYVVASVLVFSTAAYFVQQHIVNFLLDPARGQKFIYTSPAGGINFLFTVCTYVGVALSIPVIVYQLLAFLAPLIKHRTRRSIVRYSAVSAVLAAAGFCMGYFIGLPAALGFLGHQFTSGQVNPLFTIQEYLSFLTVYLVGSMLLFQLPLIVLFINRIKPLKPRTLFKGERYVILGAMVIAMIMAPTPNVIDQLIISGPVIVMYNLSIGIVWAVNRRNGRPDRIARLLEQDQHLQAKRRQSSRVPLEAEQLIPAARPNGTRKVIQVRAA